MGRWRRFSSARTSNYCLDLWLPSNQGQVLWLAKLIALSTAASNPILASLLSPCLHVYLPLKTRKRERRAIHPLLHKLSAYNSQNHRQMIYGVLCVSVCVSLCVCVCVCVCVYACCSSGDIHLVFLRWSLIDLSWLISLAQLGRLKGSQCYPG